MKNSLLILMLVICISACTSKPETQEQREQREQRIKQDTDKEVEQLANKLFPHERFVEIKLYQRMCTENSEYLEICYEKIKFLTPEIVFIDRVDMNIDSINSKVLQWKDFMENKSKLDATLQKMAEIKRKLE